MQIQLTPPLVVKTSKGKLELMPVLMQQLPSWKPSIFTRFLKPAGRRISLAAADLEKVQAFMRQYSTEAVSEDSCTAFTVTQDGLAECLPDDVPALFESEGDACQPG